MTHGTDQRPLLPRAPAPVPQDRETLARWAAGRRGVTVDFTAEPEGEYALITAGSDLFALHREPGEVVVCGWRDRAVIRARTLTAALDAFGRILPGAPLAPAGP